MILLLYCCGCTYNRKPQIESETQIVKAESKLESKDEDEKTKIVWGIDVFTPEMVSFENVLNEMLDEMGKSYAVHFTPIDVEFDGNYENYVEQYLECAKSGNYDVFTMGRFIACHDAYHRLADENALSVLFEKAERESELYHSYPEVIWDAMTYKDEIYGLLTPFLNQLHYVVCNKTYLPEEYIDKQELRLEDIGSMLRIASTADYADGFVYSVLAASFFSERYEYTPVELAVLDRTDSKVKNLLETEAYQKRMQLFDEWKKAGYLLQVDDRVRSAIEKGEFLMLEACSYSEESAVLETRSRYNISEEIELIAMEIPEDKLAFRGGGFFTALCSAGKNPTASKDLLESVYSDEKLLNALLFGKEGEDYHLLDGRAIPNDMEMGQYMILVALDNPFLSMPGAEEPKNKAELISQAISEMKPSIMINQNYELGELTSFAETISVSMQENGYPFSKEDSGKAMDELKQFLKEHKFDEIIERMNQALQKELE